MRKAILIPLLIIGITTLTVFALFSFKPTPRQDSQGPRLWRVTVLHAEPAAQQPQVELYGSIEAPHTTTLIAPSSAVVSQIFAYEGDRVHSGQILVQLDDQEERLRLGQRNAELADIRAQVASLKTQHQANLSALQVEKDLLALTETSARRYDNLVQRQMASDVTRDEAHQAVQRQRLSLIQRQQQVDDYPARLQRLEAQQSRVENQIAQTQLDLDQLQVRAPFNGRISQLRASPGQRMRLGDTVISLYDTDRLEIRAPVPARYLPALREAQHTQHSLNARAELDGQELLATFTRLASQVGARQSGVDALFQLQSIDWPELGRSITLRVGLPAISEVIAVPPQALYGQDRLYRVTDNRLDPIKVERVGKRHDDQHTLILVRGEFQRGDQILTTQLPNAVSGLGVEVVDHE